MSLGGGEMIGREQNPPHKKRALRVLAMGSWMCTISLGCHGLEHKDSWENAGRQTFSDALMKHKGIFTDALLPCHVVMRHEVPQRVMALLALQPGQVAADIGCGAGYYTFAMARAVGASGQVYAVDVMSEILQAMRIRTNNHALNPHNNVLLHQTLVSDLRLPPESLDAQLMAHLDFYTAPVLQPTETAALQSFVRALRPGGHMVVVQYLAFSGQKSITYMRANLQAAGLRIRSDEYDPARDCVIMDLVKDARR